MDSATRHVVPSTRTERAPVLDVRARAGGPAPQALEDSLLLSLISTRVTEVALLVQALARRSATGPDAAGALDVPVAPVAPVARIVSVPQRAAPGDAGPTHPAPDGATVPRLRPAPDARGAPDGTGGRDAAHLLRRLSGRELDVLRLMAQGWSNAAVAQRLHVSERTVEATTAHVFRKLELEASPQVNRRVLAVLVLLDVR